MYLRFLLAVVGWWWWWWWLLLLVGEQAEALTKAEVANRGKNNTCGTVRVTRWRGVDCTPLYTTSRPACAQCLMYVPATRVLPLETILTSHQAVLAELLTRYTITSRWGEGAYIKVNCKDVRKMMIGLIYCTISSRKGKVKATQASISSALHRGLLRLTDSRDTGTVKCKGIPSFYVQEVEQD